MHLLSLIEIKKRMQLVNDKLSCSIEFYGENIHLVWRSPTQKRVLIFDIYHVSVENKAFQRAMFETKKELKEW